MAYYIIVCVTTSAHFEADQVFFMSMHLCFCQLPRLFQPPRLLTLEIFVNLSFIATSPFIVFAEVCKLPRVFRFPLLFETREYMSKIHSNQSISCLLMEEKKYELKY